MVFKVFLEQSLKLNSWQWIIIFDLKHILLLAKAYPSIKKKDSKKYSGITFSDSSIKIVFVLVAKVIVLYVKSIIIKIWKLNFLKLLPKALIDIWLCLG